MIIDFCKRWMYAAAALLLFNSCGSNDTFVPPDTADSGTIHISADESFKPVIDSQIQVYESAHPKAKIIADYKPEAECLKDFAVDSVNLIIATRGYSKSEENFMLDSLRADPSKMTIANDAIAVIIHPQSKDSMFTMTDIRNLVSGKGPKNVVPVFDGVRATSTVRFMIDSVLKGGSLGANVVAANNSEGVIDYVAKNPNAIGFIGVSWVGNRDDTTQLSFLKKIKIAYLQSTDNPDGYIQPVQANIYYRRYPMIRDLIYILKEVRHGRSYHGLAHAFANFMTNQRGQLIFKRAYLMPALMQFNVRQATLRE